jgi:predicted nucleic acid-binding protein
VIVLDTNVLSEIVKPFPAGEVLRWMDAQNPADVFTTSITVAEMLSGVEALPPGKRRSQLSAGVEKIFVQEFPGKILPFAEDAARLFATIVASRNSSGRPISQFDGMIAAIALSHHAAVATRNTADFEGCGVHIINPWSE